MLPDEILLAEVTEQEYQTLEEIKCLKDMQREMLVKEVLTKKIEKLFEQEKRDA